MRLSVLPAYYFWANAVKRVPSRFTRRRVHMDKMSRDCIGRLICRTETHLFRSNLPWRFKGMVSGAHSIRAPNGGGYLANERDLRSRSVAAVRVVRCACVCWAACATVVRWPQTQPRRGIHCTLISAYVMLWLKRKRNVHAVGIHTLFTWSEKAFKYPEQKSERCKRWNNITRNAFKPNKETTTPQQVKWTKSFYPTCVFMWCFYVCIAISAPNSKCLDTEKKSLFDCFRRKVNIFSEIFEQAYRIV